MPGDVLKLQLTPKGNDFHFCTAQVEEFCERLGLPQKIIFKLTLVLDELITNIVSYGYDAPETYTIEVALSCDEHGLRLVVADDARPFNPLVEAEVPELELPLDERKRPVGGMGVHLVKSLMDSVAYERTDGKNVLTMHKSLDECILGQEKNT